LAGGQAMNHRLGLQDIMVVRRLQRASLQLDFRSAVLSPTTPLSAALKSLVPGYGDRITTVVVDDQSGGQRLLGFAQARDRPGRPEQDLLYVAPALSSGNGVIWTWQRLLSQIRAVGGERGIQRIFAQIDEERIAEIEVFRQSGFNIFTRDRIFRLATSRGLPPRASRVRWRPMRATDVWGLKKMNSLLVPTIVQQAEGDIGGEAGLENARDGWHLLAVRSIDYVLESDNQEITGHLQMWRGRRGIWLKLTLHPQVYDQAKGLLQEGVSLLPSGSRLPIYSDVRDYEGYLVDALEWMGFEVLVARVLMVKSLTVPIREPRRILVPALERPAGRLPTASSQG